MIQWAAKLCAWFLTGLFAVWTINGAIATGMAETNARPSLTSSIPRFGSADAQGNSLLQSQTLDSSSPETQDSRATSPETQFQQGLIHYQAGQFSSAIEQWTTAAHAFAEQSLMLEQALALGYRALGYQQLGEVSRAEEDLAASLSLLDSASNAHENSGYVEIFAKVLNIDGTLHWHRGNLEAALTSWREAEQFYQEAEDKRGWAIAQINQAKALQGLGLTRQSESLLREVYEVLVTQPDAELRATGLQNLGSVLRQLGDLETAEALLQESLLMTDDVETASAILVELGNTAWEQGDRLQSIGQVSDAESYLETAQRYYQQAIEANESIEATLNLVKLLINTTQSEATIQYLVNLPNYLDQEPSSRQHIRHIINFTEQWMQVAEQSQTAQIANVSYLDLATLLADAVQEARTLADRRSESHALGQLGRLYEQMGQTTDAQKLTQEAQLALEGLEIPEIQYRWEWQLGRLAKEIGDRPRALIHYEAAVSSLQTVRNNLLSINPDIQFSFRDNVEPVYREFVELLLTSNGTGEPSQAQLQKAIQSVDQLQLAELENYLGCEVTAIGQVDDFEDETAAIIYPIVLGDRLAIITQLPDEGELSYQETVIPQQQMEETLQALRLNLTFPDRTPEVIEGATQLYDWLIRPIEADLEQSGVKTLVFVPDGALRNVPMGVLFDGEQYLIQKGYATAIAPRLELFLPNPSSNQLRVKLGGVGIPQEIEDITFPVIVKLKEELDRIAQVVEATPPLLNESFTVANIQHQLQQNPVSAIHWKTHGIFSSDPTRSYIVGFQERINTAALNELIAIGSQGGNQPLELLVLSACETAQGDNRAVLGLAGLAARTGTRSVISALWIAFDTPNTEFMVRFYELLAQEGLTKAEAVRQAQLALINDYGYTTPYIWANYILIGNWL